MLPRCLRIRVGGLTLAVRARQPTRALVPPPRFVPFLVRRGGDIRLLLTRQPPELPPRADLLFDSGSVWRVYRRPRGLLYTFRTRALDPPLYKAVAIDAALRRGALLFPARDGALPRYALDFPLDELLFQHRLAREGAMEVHACGVLLDGRVLLFCGRSGAGKSTTARLWRKLRPSAPLLSDDRIVLRPRRGGIRAFGTPWHGDGGFASAGSGALGAVFFLRHGRRTRTRRVPPAEAAARLFSRSFPPPWDARALASVLEACGRVTACVPCFELVFRPDATAVEAVLEVLGLA